MFNYLITNEKRVYVRNVWMYDFKYSYINDSLIFSSLLYFFFFHVHLVPKLFKKNMLAVQVKADYI